MNRYLKRLIQEHRAIDKKLSGAVYASPQVRELKRLKLRLRDRIESFRRRKARQAA